MYKIYDKINHKELLQKNTPPGTTWEFVEPLQHWGAFTPEEWTDLYDPTIFLGEVIATESKGNGYYLLVIVVNGYQED
jgi:hypothetical protein